MFRKSLTLALILILTNEAWSQEKRFLGVVIPVPTKHYRGSPQNGFPVSKIHVQMGDRVKKGDLLIELDPALLPLRLKEAQLKSAEAVVVISKHKHKVCNNSMKRCEDLRQIRSDFVSGNEMDTLVGAAASSKVAIEKAQADAEAAKLLCGIAKYQFDNYSHMKSSIDGVVTKVSTALGLVARSQTKEVVWIEVIDLSVVEVHLFVPTELGAKLRQAVGTSTTIHRGEVSWQGKIRAIGYMVNEKDQVLVVLEVPNPKETLLPGMKVEASLPSR